MKKKEKELVSVSHKKSLSNPKSKIKLGMSSERWNIFLANIGGKEAKYFKKNFE